MTRPGTLYGLGTGPGDPELLTLKAWRLLNAVDVVAYPVTTGSISRARKIAEPFLHDGLQEMPFELPMQRQREPARKAYENAARAIGDHLSAGRHVACLCEGDPMLYGSFMYLARLLSPGHKVEIVPGVTSLTACAAAAQMPLAARNDVLSIIPAPLPPATLKARICDAQAVMIIKVGRHLEKVMTICDDLGLSERAMLVEDASASAQRIVPLSQAESASAAYFSSILIYKGKEPW